MCLQKDHLIYQKSWIIQHFVTHLLYFKKNICLLLFCALIGYGELCS